MKFGSSNNNNKKIKILVLSIIFKLEYCLGFEVKKFKMMFWVSHASLTIKMFVVLKYI